MGQSYVTAGADLEGWAGVQGVRTPPLNLRSAPLFMIFCF